MKNTVQLIGWYGGDQTHAQAMWTSTGKTLTPESIERIPERLQMLITGSDGNAHTTPFERSLLHFQATVDTASHIHLLKHRHFSINGESARYKEYTEDKYYVPGDWDHADDTDLENHVENSYAKYHHHVNFQKYGNARKRLKESARFYLPYAIQVNLDFSCNFLAFAHFQKLRNAQGAQLEIREIAQEMLRLVKEETNGDFEHSLKAWGYV